MLPAVALVGRPNVGKSTLFNRLTATRDALVADYPGLTRDRRYGVGRAADRRFIVIDTGGLTAADSTAMTALVAAQVDIAIDEMDRVAVAGRVYGPFDYGSGSGLEDALVLRLSPEGSVGFAWQLGTPQQDWARALAIAPGNVVFVVGTTEGTMGELENQGSVDAFVYRLDDFFYYY